MLNIIHYGNIKSKNNLLIRAGLKNDMLFDTLFTKVCDCFIYTVNSDLIYSMNVFASISVVHILNIKHS